jgi:regulator of sigma E protease
VSSDILTEIISIYIYPGLLVFFFFGLTIFIHEFGHFIMARRRGMKIERFSLGFGPAIWQWKRDGIEYRISWIPFGGYVSLPQMAPMEAIEGKTKSKPDELPPASPKSKTMVAFCGPMMNMVLAFLIAFIVWGVGMPMPSNSTVVGWVDPDSPEEHAGILVGDRVTAINGRPVKRWTEIRGEVVNSHEPNIAITLEREGKPYQRQLEVEPDEHGGARILGLYPESRPFAQRIIPGSPAEQAGLLAGDKFLAVEGVPIMSADQLRGIIGNRADQLTEVKVLRHGQPVIVKVTPQILERNAKRAQMGVRLGDEIVRPGPTPLDQIWESLQMIGYTVKALFYHKETGVGIGDLSGPVGIVGGLWAMIAYGGVRSGLWLAVVLNVNLAVLNLLPIPVLDGGHILFAAIEWVRRKPLNARLINVTQTAFAALIITFMLYVTFHDFERFFPAKPKTQTSEPAPAPQP